MPGYGHELRFGVFITPDAARAAEVVELARLADVTGLDLVTFQDHPYQRRHLDAWTLLSVVAAATTSVQVSLNVANLPLRPPLVLAQSAATLDILSGGRVALGLGAGGFWEAIAAYGVPRLTPGQSVDALSEGIDLIRAAWAADGAGVTYAGEHHRARGAKPGPPPAHPIELWVGAYKPRMLALTGAKADGWLPSLGYLDPGDLPALNARIDAAARDAGRKPEDVRRLLNITPGAGPEQLAALALEDGISTFILPVDDPDGLRRFAEDVAPAVRELVAGGAAPATASAPARPADDAPLAAAPTPDPGTRLSAESAWDESIRPTAGPAEPARRYTPHEQAAGRHLIDVHDALRAELEQLRDLVAQVARGTTDPAAARSFITRMTIRQNNWTLGTFCESYCRIVTSHHTLEDRSVFPHLRRADGALGAVLDRLEEEHVTIAELLERVDAALVDLVAGEGLEGVQAAVDLLTDALLSHFSYEERELVEPLARLGFH